jgi:hypothetical protein
MGIRTSKVDDAVFYGIAGASVVLLSYVIARALSRRSRSRAAFQWSSHPHMDGSSHVVAGIVASCSSFYCAVPETWPITTAAGDGARTTQAQQTGPGAVTSEYRQGARNALASRL